MTPECAGTGSWWDALRQAAPLALDGSPAFAFVVALAVVPGLLLVVAEWTWGDAHELAGRAWAAAFVPLAVALAIVSWSRVLKPAAPGCEFAPEPLIALGFASTIILALGTRIAARRARRRRKPLSPAPETA